MMIQPSPFGAYQFYRGGSSSGVRNASRSVVSRESIYGDDDFNDYGKNQVISGGGEAVVNAGFPVASMMGAGAGLARFANLTIPAGLVLERRPRAKREPLSEEYALCAVEELQFSRLFNAIADIQSNPQALSGKRTTKSSRKLRWKKTRRASS
jgi:hypothetical protein